MIESYLDLYLYIIFAIKLQTIKVGTIIIPICRIGRTRLKLNLVTAKDASTTFTRGHIV